MTNATFLKPLRKYYAVFSLTIQQELYYSASFIVDRARSITIIIAFYAFWSAIFQDRAELLGYTRSQMFTYILGMNVLRALVFSDKQWDIIREINTGKISSYLIRPISYVGFSMSRDLADKFTQMLSSILEVMIAIWLLKIPLYAPQSAWTLPAFLCAVFLAVVLYFLMSYTVSAVAFWTAESGGPRFCFELFLEFSSGAFFPLDVLPGILKTTFEILPFSSLLYFPLNVYLERMSFPMIVQGIVIQVFWIGCFACLARYVWMKGLRAWGAEGG